MPTMAETLRGVAPSPSSHTICQNGPYAPADDNARETVQIRKCSLFVNRASA